MIAPERAGAKRHLNVQTTAEALLAHLKRNGTDYFFVNAGTDFASVVEAYARLDESGLEFPTPLVATHENLAVGMAHGYYLIARVPQAVMCHVSVGSANAICAVMNARRDQIRSSSCRAARRSSNRPFGSRNGDIHWAQEMFPRRHDARDRQVGLRTARRTQRRAGRRSRCGIAQAARRIDLPDAAARSAAGPGSRRRRRARRGPAVPAPPSKSRSRRDDRAALATASFPSSSPRPAARIRQRSHRLRPLRALRRARRPESAVRNAPAIRCISSNARRTFDEPTHSCFGNHVPWIRTGEPAPGNVHRRRWHGSALRAHPDPQFPGRRSLTTTVARSCPTGGRLRWRGRANRGGAAQIAAIRERGRAP